ncbi:hypothetical protein EON67_06790 [archaeon]|nr:MAG: hypothetical protein EON67_06790 [archaeon]
MCLWCRLSWEAAVHAAGAVAAAIDDVVAGRHRNAFCAVRPPGHHAGPRGIVTCPHDREGSHGFCLLNNVAIGAAYARANYGRARASYGAALQTGVAAPPEHVTLTAGTAPIIRRIAIFDFDVHHGMYSVSATGRSVTVRCNSCSVRVGATRALRAGNGTEAIIRAQYPTEVCDTVPLSFGMGAFSAMTYRPWLDEKDGEDTMFVSMHGYGRRDGCTCTAAPVRTRQ